jgi:hypothetical protein
VRVRDEIRTIYRGPHGVRTYFDRLSEVMEVQWLMTLHDGLATHVETFTDKAQALEAAGLRE